ncbi:hypothetical protein BDW74DRAFT_173560 [Aspergillus multicolor]|uniref:uncharacterized protein n=1 Tax=Aspergillus multicolor TaxID=41759 RepID=UPI003CCD5BC0
MAHLTSPPLLKSQGIPVSDNVSSAQHPEAQLQVTQSRASSEFQAVVFPPLLERSALKQKLSVPHRYTCSPLASDEEIATLSIHIRACSESSMVASQLSDVEAQPFETKEYDSYAWVLLEDHPLRSYPDDANCHPEITAFTRKCSAFIRQRWRERGLPLLCFVLMFFVIVQFLVQLPHIVSYFLEPELRQDLPGFIQTLDTVDRSLGLELDHAAICVYDVSAQAHMQGVTGDAVEYTLASGCTGAKVDLWQRNGELLVGSSPSDSDDERTLQSVYVQSLQAQLDARNSASLHSTGENGDEDDLVQVGLFDEDPKQSFTLLLDVQTPMRRAWPSLVAQLEALNERGYLSYRSAEQGLVLRPVTVVVSGRGCRRLSLLDDLSRAIKGFF